MIRHAYIQNISISVAVSLFNGILFADVVMPADLPAYKIVQEIEPGSTTSIGYAVHGYQSNYIWRYTKITEYHLKSELTEILLNPKPGDTPGITWELKQAETTFRNLHIPGIGTWVYECNLINGEAEAPETTSNRWVQISFNQGPAQNVRSEVFNYDWHATPEPNTITMSLIGVGALIVVRRIRFQKRGKVQSTAVTRAEKMKPRET